MKKELTLLIIIYLTVCFTYLKIIPILNKTEKLIDNYYKKNNQIIIDKSFWVSIDPNNNKMCLQIDPNYLKFTIGDL